MIQIIKTHNLLDGLLFSILEILAMVLVVSPFAIYYLTHERFMDKEEREKIGHANAHLLADTLKITITALLPFVLITLVAYEFLSRREGIS